MSHVAAFGLDDKAGVGESVAELSAFLFPIGDRMSHPSCGIGLRLRAMARQAVYLAKAVKKREKH